MRDVVKNELPVRVMESLPSLKIVRGIQDRGIFSGKASAAGNGQRFVRLEGIRIIVL